MSGSTRFTAARPVQVGAARPSPASGRAYRVVVGDRQLAAADVARIVTERALLAWVECAQHETRSSPRPARSPGDDHAARQAASTPAGQRLRAAATNSATGTATLSARASNSEVSLCAVRWMPRSRSLAGRGLKSAARPIPPGPTGPRPHLPQQPCKPQRKLLRHGLASPQQASPRRTTTWHSAGRTCTPG
jgi:hypothetical protein